MADILPINNMLATINEGVNFNVTFTPSLASGDTLTSLKIISHNLPSNINVSGASYSGMFKNNFDLPFQSLKYREGDQLKAVSAFQQLPPKGSVDIYEYRAPSSMLKNFSITIKMDYNEVDPTTTTSTPKSITKTYTQPIRGSYDNFTQQLLNYLGV